MRGSGTWAIFEARNGVLFPVGRALDGKSPPANPKARFVRGPLDFVKSTQLRAWSLSVCSKRPDGFPSKRPGNRRRTVHGHRRTDRSNRRIVVTVSGGIDDDRCRPRVVFRRENRSRRVVDYRGNYGVVYALVRQSAPPTPFLGGWGMKRTLSFRIYLRRR